MGVGILNAGTSSPEVKAIQQGLNIRGAAPTLAEDGIFGPMTDHAVREYQSEHGLKVDGIVGPKTRKSLFWIGVATVTIVGRRDPKVTYLWPRNGGAQPGAGPIRWPPAGPVATLLPGQLHLPDFDELNTTICNGLCATAIRPRHIRPLPMPVPTPVMPDWNFTIDPLRPSEPFKPLELVYDHVELAPGEESTFALRRQRQDAFVLTMQSIYRRGPDDGPNLQAALGVQVGAPFMSGSWTVNPFLQLTDVDRLGALGAFHYWHAYAQIGSQTLGGGGAAQPTLASSLFPVHLTLNVVKDIFSVGLGAGVALNLDLQSGRIQAGPQLTFGLTVELGHPEAPW
jgi:hypothetical protein